MNLDLVKINADLGRNAQVLVDWAVGLDQPAIITTNFRPFEAVILHMVMTIWCVTCLRCKPVP